MSGGPLFKRHVEEGHTQETMVTPTYLATGGCRDGRLCADAFFPGYARAVTDVGKGGGYQRPWATVPLDILFE